MVTADEICTLKVTALEREMLLGLFLLDGSQNGCSGRGLTVERPLREDLVGCAFRERTLRRGDSFWAKRDFDISGCQICPVHTIATAPGHGAYVCACDAVRTFHPAGHHLQVGVAIAIGMRPAHCK